jgi:NitT/TauT family transport system ATP-binding protein
MDEPLAALDAQTRAIMQTELLRIWESDKKTVVYITHSIDEAVLLGDRVILMTARPGVNKACYEVPFERPRDLRLTATASFAELSYGIWESLQEEVKKAMEEQLQ